jgi:hypothetical protein
MNEFIICPFTKSNFTSSKATPSSTGGCGRPVTVYRPGNTQSSVDVPKCAYMKRRVPNYEKDGIWLMDVGGKVRRYCTRKRQSLSNPYVR